MISRGYEGIPLNSYRRIDRGFLHYLTVFAMIVAPLTSLRFWYIGVAEIFFIALMLRNFVATWKKSYLKRMVISRFWLPYLFFILVGFLYKNLIGIETSSSESIIFDLLAYIVVMIACVNVEFLVVSGRLNAFLLMRHVFYFASILFSILFVISTFTPTLFGFPLLYYDYFSPLVLNLHHFSMFMSPLIFIGYFIFKGERGVGMLLAGALVVVDVVMVFNSGSFKAVAGFFVGVFICCVLPIYDSIKTNNNLKVIFWVGMFTFFYFFLLVGGWEVFRVIFDEADSGGGRTALYYDGFLLALKSFPFGLGPGSHLWSNYEWSDTHQTLLTCFLQAGIFGVVLISVLYFRIWKRLFYSPELLAAFSTILIYSAGGDIMRRLPTWIFLILLLHFKLEIGRRKKDHSAGIGARLRVV